MPLTSPLTRICQVCGHRLITVSLDTGTQLELDTQAQCYVLSGREIDGLPVYLSSRAYVMHSAVCHTKKAP